MNKDEKLQLMHLALRVFEVDTRTSFIDIYNYIKNEMLDGPKSDNRPTAQEYFNKSNIR